MATRKAPTSNRAEILTEKDHRRMDKCLKQVLKDFEAGRLTEAAVLGGLVHAITAVDAGNRSEINTWLLDASSWKEAED